MNDIVLPEHSGPELRLDAPQLQLADLRTVLVECAGDLDDMELGEAALDRLFTDLGYDSLAILETAAAVGQRYGVELRDEDVAEAVTPRAFLLLVNRTLATAAQGAPS
ncbi:acyl carrier protein [Streptomyces sp. NPDC014676]|uniref:acyl carrier protein n=1 Tax=Streptomyces sp. NPDC014676 TaxID=3364879 RepID=UPI0036F5564C